MTEALTIFAFFWSLINEEKKTRKQETKANRIITLDGENGKKVQL